MPSPELLAHVAEARARKAFVSSDYDPVQMRELLRVPPDLERSSTFVDCGAHRIERRGTPDAPRLLFCVAGGGFFMGPTDAHRALLDRLCASLGAQAALLHHRLAPEHPFPAAYDDTYDALDRAFGFAGIRRVDVVADSSGAALALCALRARRDRGLPMPGALALFSPLADLALTGRSHVANADADPMFGPQALIHKGRLYLQGANPTDPRVSPLWGPLHGMPPMIAFAGSTEVMLDDAVRLAERVNAAGGRAELVVCEQAPHVYPLVATLPEAESALERVLAFFAAS